MIKQNVFLWADDVDVMSKSMSECIHKQFSAEVVNNIPYGYECKKLFFCKLEDLIPEDENLHDRFFEELFMLVHKMYNPFKDNDIILNYDDVTEWVMDHLTKGNGRTKFIKHSSYGMKHICESEYKKGWEEDGNNGYGYCYVSEQEMKVAMLSATSWFQSDIYGSSIFKPGRSFFITRDKIDGFGVKEMK